LPTGLRNVWGSLASHCEGKTISSPNDIVKSGRHDLLDRISERLADPRHGGNDVQRYLDWQGVFRMTEDGTLAPMVTDFAGSNGLTFSPD
jgi:gluconolactonase